jgi:hypothetical protein
VVVKTEGQLREDPELYNHVDLVQLLDIVDLESGSTVAGSCASKLHLPGSLTVLVGAAKRFTAPLQLVKNKGNKSAQGYTPRAGQSKLLDWAPDSNVEVTAVLMYCPLRRRQGLLPAQRGCAAEPGADPVRAAARIWRRVPPHNDALLHAQGHHGRVCAAGAIRRRALQGHRWASMQMTGPQRALCL